MKYLKIRIELGTSDSLFDIYYDSVSSGTRALLYDTGLPAIGLTNEVLEFVEGVTVSVPDNATSIILSSDPKAFCTEIPGFNLETYTIPIGCISYTVSASAGIFNYFYTDCNCNPVTATIDATYGYAEETFCALQDSVSAGPLTVVNNGYCLTPTPTQTSTPVNTPTQTPTPSVTPIISNCLCFSTTYETIPSGLQVRWRDCTSGQITTQQISNLLTRDNLDGTFTSYICLQQGLSYETPVCVSGGVEVTCDPLTWVEGGTCSDSVECDCPFTIYTHGALRATCGDFCNTNYLIQTTDCATETYSNLGIGDFIYGYSGQAGYIAYSNISTDTTTGPFRIADIDGTGEILGIYVCSGGSCVPL